MATSSAVVILQWVFWAEVCLSACQWGVWCKSAFVMVDCVSDQDPEPGPFSTGLLHRQGQPGCLTNPAWWVLCSGNWSAESAQTVFHLLSAKPRSWSEHVFTHKGHKTTTTTKRPNPDVWSVFTTAKFTQIHFNVSFQTCCDCCRSAGFVFNVNNDTNMLELFQCKQTFKAS